jgi:hypothetical protein
MRLRWSTADRSLNQALFFAQINMFHQNITLVN